MSFPAGSDSCSEINDAKKVLSELHESHASRGSLFFLLSSAFVTLRLSQQLKGKY